MALADLQTAIQGLESALAADSVNPQATYTLDGLTVSQNEWRENLTNTIAALKKQVNQYQPYIIRTAQRL